MSYSNQNPKNIIITKLANLLYSEWLKTHDTYELDFLDELETFTPGLKWSYNTEHTEIFIIHSDL